MFNQNYNLMLLTVFGATGQVGKRIVRYALAKGHTVKAFGRNVNDLIDEDLRSDKLEAIKGSVFDEDEVYSAVEGSDAILSALGGAFTGEDKTRSLGLKTIASQMIKADVKRLIAVGGMGVLNAPNDTYILDSPDYPPQYLPVGKEHLQAFLNIKDTTLDWTFVCPPNIRDEDATENYITSETYPPEVNYNFITAGDLAHFMINEAEKPMHIRKRVGISGLK